MNETRTIEIDAAIADELEARAARRGLSVDQMLAEFFAIDNAPLVAGGGDIAELDTQWADIQSGAPTVPHDQVARWLETWGTAAFKPWRER